MKYLLLINNDDETTPTSEEEMAADMQAWFAYDATLQEAGIVLAGEALHHELPAATVHRGSGQVTDGPFAEAKEVIGGFYLVDVPDRDAAVAWAQKMPGDGTVDVVGCMEFEQ